MVRYIHILILCCWSFTVAAQPACITSLRQNFSSIIASKTLVSDNLKALRNDCHPCCRAYRGLLNAVMASKSIWPNDKYAYFVKAKHDLESAVSRQPSNAEIRLMRLIVQANAPSFLGYNKHMDEDTELLMHCLRQGTGFDNRTMRFMIDRLLETPLLTQAHKTELVELKKKYA